MPQQSFFDDEDDEDFSLRAGPSRLPANGVNGRDRNGNAGVSARTGATSPSSRYGASYAPRFQSADITGETSFGRTTVDGGEYDGHDDGEGEGDEAELDRILGRDNRVPREDVSEVVRLSQAWVRERGTVDLMRWEGEVVEDCLTKLTQQVGYRANTIRLGPS